MGKALANVRSTSTPAVCGAIMRRCRCRRAAGCRPRLLAIPPFQSARAGAPVQAPKTASLLVSRQWPWTYVVATSSTSWKRWRGRPPANSWALGDRRQDVRLQRMQHDVCRGDLVQGAPVRLKVVTRPRDVLMGHNPRNQCELEFVSGVYPGRRFHRLTGRRIFVLHGSVPMAIMDVKIASAVL